MKKRSGIKGIIFDLGSTLIEFENRTWDEMTHEGQLLGYNNLENGSHRLPDYDTFVSQLEAVKNEYRAVARTTYVEWDICEAVARYFTELGLDNAQKQSGRFVGLFYGIVREQVTLCDGAIETLRALKDQGFRLGLISNTIFPRAEHEVDIRAHGLAPFLDFRVYSSEFGKRKPHPDIYRYGLKKIGLSAEQTVFVGDRYLEDVQGPAEVGMPGILKFRAGREYPNPMPPGTIVVHSLSEILSILE